MLTANDLIVGHVYSAKKLKRTVFGAMNDRQILHLGVSQVQYDSPTVQHGRHYPKVSFEQFLKWADADITASMPAGDWRN
jgi:hypothetical protein